MEVNDKRDLLIEYSICSNDPIYVIEKYFETFDKTREGFVPFNLFEEQKKLIANYRINRFNIVLKYRQAGISTVTAAYCATQIAFALESNPEKVLILANKQETAIEFLNKITEFIKQLPSWLSTGFTKSSQKHVKFVNLCEIKAVATSKDALRGYTPTLLILDEAAFIEGGQALWSACLAAVSTGGKIMLISTPNGIDEIYYEAYNSSINHTNDFVITHLKWRKDPRYNKDLRLIKTPDILDWIQRPPEERKNDVIENVNTQSEEFILKKISEGYKPHSSWYEKMCRDMNLNKRTIFQELECVDFKSIITIRDKVSGEIKNVQIGDFYNELGYEN